MRRRRPLFIATVFARHRAPRKKRESAVSEARTGLLERLAGSFRNEPIEMASRVVGLLAVLGGGIWMLGAWSQRIREAYLLLPALQYPAKVPLVNGVEALGGLFLNGTSAPFSSVDSIQMSVLMVVLASPLVFWGAPLLERQWRFSGIAALAIIGVFLLFGLRFYSAAIFPFGDGRDPGTCGDSSVSVSLEKVVTESCSWLEHGNSENALHRQELAGLLLWLLVLSIAATAAAVRLRDTGKASGWARRGLIAMHAVFLLFLVRLLPAAHAYESFGLTYPAVELIGKDCDTTLRVQDCCIYDVTGDAEAIHLLLRGAGCPSSGIYPWAKSPEEKSCGRVLKGRRPVMQGCG